MHRTILAFTGYPGTGKSTLAEHLAETYNFFTFEGSDYVKVLAESEGIQLKTRQEFTDYMQQTRRQMGADWIAQTMLKRPEGRLLNTGLRTQADFETIRAAGGKVIALTCNPHLCVARMPDTPKSPKTIEEYFEHVELESSPEVTGLDVSWTSRNADYFIDTGKPIEHTIAKLNAYVEAQFEA